MNGTLHKVRRLAAALFMLIASLPALAGFAAEKSAEPARERLRIGYVTLTGNHMSGWAAYESGAFRKQGLDVELVNAVSGATAVKILLSGEAQFGQIAGPPALESRLQGADIVMLAGLVNTMNYQFVVGKEIKQPDHLKGKAVAVSRFGSSSDFATRYALDRYGLVPGKDVAIVEIGNQPQRFAALVTGKIQALMLELPLSFKARKMGFQILTNLQTLGLEYPALTLTAMQPTIKSRPDLVRKVLTGYIEGIHYLKTHPNEALAILQKYLRTDDPAELRETYEAGLNLIPDKPYPTLKGIQNVLREFSVKYPKAQTARPEQFVNSRFLKELDSSGFIDGLYKATPATMPARRN